VQHIAQSYVWAGNFQLEAVQCTLLVVRKAKIHIMIGQKRKRGQRCTSEKHISMVTTTKAAGAAATLGVGSMSAVTAVAELANFGVVTKPRQNRSLNWKLTRLT
jgi:hypothetical protein